MPVAMLNPVIGLIGAAIIFAGSIFNISTNSDIHVDKHKETKTSVIFYVKTKDNTNPDVVVNKKDGSVRIKFKNKRSDIEFDLEYSGELTPKDRETVDEIMKSVLEHTKKDKTLKSRIKSKIKDFVLHKL